MSQHYESFEDFYPYYLEEHSNRTNRRLHFIGSTALFFYGLLSLNLATFGKCLLGALLIGYGSAWVGHFFFEHNKPATFQYPWMSYKGDWKMWWQMLTGKIRF